MIEYDLSKLYISVEHDQEKGFVESKPELSSFKEFKDAGDITSKIAILSGDIDSPFVRIKDRKIMIKSIFDYLGIKDKDFMNDVIEYRHLKYVDAWVKYLFILNEIEFTNWLLAKKDYEYFLFKSTQPQAEGEPDDKYLKKRNDYRKTISDLGDAVKSIEGKLFPDSKAAREAALSESRKKIKLYSEAYAQPFNYY